MGKGPERTLRRRGQICYLLAVGHKKVIGPFCKKEGQEDSKDLNVGCAARIQGSVVMFFLINV